MRFFVLASFIVSSILFPLAAFAAASIELTWDIPTERVDGTPLEAEEIDGYSLVYSLSNGAQQELMLDGALTLKTTLTDVQAGVYVFMIATISGGVTGPYSNPVTLSLEEKPKSAPAAPTIRMHLTCDNCNLEVK